MHVRQTPNRLTGNTHNPQNTYNARWGERLPQPTGLDGAVVDDGDINDPTWGAGAVAPAALGDRNRGLERPSNGGDGRAEASHSTNPRRHTKQPGVE